MTAAACAGLALPVQAATVPSGFDAMLRRPLFSPSRRPPAPPPELPAALAAPVSPPSLPAPPPTVSLSGVITGGGFGLALLQRPGTPAPIRVALGAQVDGWTVVEIRPRAIVLRLGARSVTIDLPAR